MTLSQSMVLYRPPPTTSSLSTTTGSTSGSLISTRYFTASTGTAIATELLYRLLFDILNRILHSVQRFTSAKLDQLSIYLERRRLERQNERLEAARAVREGSADKNGRLRIVEEVGKAAEERGFIAHCPMKGDKEPRPPRWVASVLKGAEEGRMEERDFWIHTHTG
ncbi:hypothetical protein K491DRAFT_691750 [Lophiostoma macrostomum CBS 122681]|uniref:Uncharacterized protein n=1 Tax=Lophiostoma macrostomum CBS 122681 TaxID=1314788 RepID=A0A6A6T9Q7_9PLEO|nr:hypothetical protein K491DRAFT_691750 [Lophiostoma macrostomum CBS 122681]